MSSLKLSIAAYLTTFFIIVVLKPSICFTEDNQIKGFGVQDDCTLYNIYMISFIFALIVYFINSIVYIKK